LFRATLWQLGASAPLIFSGAELGRFLDVEYRMGTVGIGALLGAVGSLVAVRRFLRA